MVLTQVGRVFLVHAQRVAEEISEAESAVGELQGAVRGLLRVASPAVFGRSSLAPILPTFLAAHPELRVELELTNRMIDPLEEGFDVVIRTGPLTNSSSLIARELGVSTYGTYASLKYLAAHAPIKTPRDLANHLVIDTFKGSERHNWEFERAGVTSSVEVRPRLDINDAAVRREMATSSMGIALIPDWIASRALREERLVTVLPEWKPTRLAPLNAVWPVRRNPSPRLRAFLAFLSDTVPRVLARDIGG